MKTLQLYLSDLKEILEAREFVMARSLLKEVSPIDLADAWGLFSVDERLTVFRLCTRQRALQLFEELDPPYQQEMLKGLQGKDVEELLEHLDPTETARMARDLSPVLLRQLLGIMKKGGQEETVKRLMEYPPKSVGALMRSRFVTLDVKWTVKQAMERVQASTRLRHIEETHLDNLMVLGADGTLTGIVSLKELVVAPGAMTLPELMDDMPHVLPPEADQEEALRLFSKYKLKSIPVTSPTRQLMGVVVYRDMFEVAEQETEEDFAKMAGLRAGGIHASPWATVRVRLPWLIVTCIGGLIVSGIVKRFEATLAQVVALATFIPLIAGMGGNVGSQTATVVVRGLATGEIAPGTESRLVAKEIAVGVMLGLFYGIVVGAAALLFYGSRYGWRFAVVVSSAMFVSMTVAAAGGSIQPFLLRRMGVDPATAAGPLITTFTDMLSNLVYFGLATWFLLGLS